MNLGLYVGLGLGAVVGATTLLLWARLAYWRSLAEDRREAYDDILDRALKAEAEGALIVQSYESLKLTINGMLQRPVIAQLSDAQANAFIQHIVAWLNVNQQDAAKLS